MISERFPNSPPTPSQARVEQLVEQGHSRAHATGVAWAARCRSGGVRCRSIITNYCQDTFDGRPLWEASLISEEAGEPVPIADLPRMARARLEAEARSLLRDGPSHHGRDA